MEKAIFLDRDGVINEDSGYITNIKDIKIINGVPQALKILNKEGFKLFVITNQPAIGRGLATEKEIENIHEFMNWQIIKTGGPKIDKFYYCPHHPNANLVKYRKVCECRKPSPGMILQALKEYDIDPKKSWMIGDRVTDIIPGKNAGCKTIQLRSQTSNDIIVSGIPFDKNTKADYNTDTLLEAAKLICEFEGR